MPESEDHLELKEMAKQYLQEERGFSESEIFEEHRIEMDDLSFRVDVVGLRNDLAIGIECGKLSGHKKRREAKINILEEAFDDYRILGYEYLKEGRSLKFIDRQYLQCDNCDHVWQPQTYKPQQCPYCNVSRQYAEFSPLTKEEAAEKLETEVDRDE